MARKTDLIRVDKKFAEALRRASEEQGITIVDITETLSPTVKKKKRSCDPFALTIGDD